MWIYIYIYPYKIPYKFPYKSLINPLRAAYQYLLPRNQVILSAQSLKVYNPHFPTLASGFKMSISLHEYTHVCCSHPRSPGLHAPRSQEVQDSMHQGSIAAFKGLIGI